MKPGQLVALNPQLGVYGKIPRKALQNLSFLRLLNKRLSRPWNGTIRAKLRAGNRLLEKNGFGPIQMLTAKEILTIKRLQGPPPGSLLCRPR